MLTLLDAISLAGSRSKQNDDAWGLTFNRAFVIDGATDLHDAPISGSRSDASWLARTLAQAIYAAEANLGPPDLISFISSEAASRWAKFPGAASAPAWMQPIAAGLIVTEKEDGLEVLDAGDCRIFVEPGDQTAYCNSGSERAAESARAASLGVIARETLDLSAADRMSYLRSSRENTVSQSSALGLTITAPASIRQTVLRLKKPAHFLIATDGFSSLADVYTALSPQDLLRTALDGGLLALGAHLRALEQDDPDGARFPRWKRSDDATALLVRFE